MAVAKIVSIDEFKKMLSYKPCVEKYEDKQNLKMKMLEEIQQAYGDKYYLLKNETKAVLEHMCFFSCERGYFFASDDYFAKEYGIADSTVRNQLRFLRKKGLIVTVYRRSTKHNGRGNPVHIFVSHPYFKYWVQFLKLEDYQSNYQTDYQAENDEIRCDSRVSEQKKDSTINSPASNLSKEITNLSEKEKIVFYKFPIIIENVLLKKFDRLITFKFDIDEIYLDYRTNSSLTDAQYAQMLSIAISEVKEPIRKTANFLRTAVATYLSNAKPVIKETKTSKSEHNSVDVKTDRQNNNWLETLFSSVKETDGSIDKMSAEEKTEYFKRVAALKEKLKNLSLSS